MCSMPAILWGEKVFLFLSPCGLGDWISFLNPGVACSPVLLHKDIGSLDLNGLFHACGINSTLRHSGRVILTFQWDT